VTKTKKIVFGILHFPQRYQIYVLQSCKRRIHGRLDDGTMTTGLDVTLPGLVGYLYAPTPLASD
jgi:hypothetical protein